MGRYRYRQVLLVLLVITLIVSAGCTAPKTPRGEDRGGPGEVFETTPGPLPAGQAEESATAAPEGTGEAEKIARPLTHGAVYRTGDTLTISKETILSPGNHLLVEVTPLTFGPEKKGVSLPVSGVSGVVPVTREEGAAFSTWSFGFNTTGWEPGMYLVSVRGIEVPAFYLDMKFTLAARD